MGTLFCAHADAIFTKDVGTKAVPTLRSNISFYLRVFAFICGKICFYDYKVSIMVTQKKARIKIRAEDYHQREDGGNMKNHLLHQVNISIL